MKNQKSILLLIINIITLTGVNSQCLPIVFPKSDTIGNGGKICLEGSRDPSKEICFENLNGNLNFLFNGSNKFTFLNSSNNVGGSKSSLGIGYLNPLAELHVNGSIAIGELLNSPNYIQSGFRIDYNDSTTSNTFFRNFRSSNFIAFTREIIPGTARYVFGINAVQNDANLLYLYGKNDDVKIQLSTHSNQPTYFDSGKIIIGGNSNFGNTNYVNWTVGSYKLYVANGGILTDKIKVAVTNSSQWSDYVFDKNYKLKPLEEVEKYIKENKHLQGIPSSDELIKEGLDIAEMQSKQMEKIEELTLYLIELKKEIDVLKRENIELKKQLHKKD